MLVSGTPCRQQGLCLRVRSARAAAARPPSPARPPPPAPPGPLSVRARAPLPRGARRGVTHCRLRRLEMTGAQLRATKRPRAHAHTSTQERHQRRRTYRRIGTADNCFGVALAQLVSSAALSGAFPAGAAAAGVDGDAKARPLVTAAQRV
eukprot:101406-Chlamydomonas_euryale.AAC.1